MAKVQPTPSGLLSEYILQFFQFNPPPPPEIFLHPPLKGEKLPYRSMIQRRSGRSL